MSWIRAGRDSSRESGNERLRKRHRNRVVGSQAAAGIVRAVFILTVDDSRRKGSDAVTTWRLY